MTIEGNKPRIAVLGASGLIGHAVAEALARAGFPVRAVARRFTDAQVATFGQDAVISPVVDLDPAALAGLLEDQRPDIVLNCIGVLQDGPYGSTHDVHLGFVSRLLRAIEDGRRPMLLLHMSVPGAAPADATPFSRTKREAEALISRSAVPFVIMRPGFVVAPNAYGGSALVRALAALPFTLPSVVTTRPFRVTALDDIVETISLVSLRWAAGERNQKTVWDVVSDEPSTVGSVVDAFRRRLGGPTPGVALPTWLLTAGACAGDAAAQLGWQPPVRTTALREMMRGVDGDPRSWAAETTIAPKRLDDIVRGLPLTIQDRWFARLYLLKAVILVILAAFWITSGLITLLPAFTQASAMLIAHGFPAPVAKAVTIATSLTDILVGAAIGFRRTCQTGLQGGIALSLFYMASAALLAPTLWFDPLGALVKTGPAIVLMAVALAVLDAR